MEVHVVPSTSKLPFKSLELYLQLMESQNKYYWIMDLGSLVRNFHSSWKEMELKDILTSLYHPSSKGLAERAVKTLKNGIRKLEGDVQE